MQRKALLIAGLIALAASLIGPAVQAAITGDAGWWGHMSGFGHMGWRGEGQTTGDVIQGASQTEVTATEFAFSPDELTVMVGEAVNLTLINAGDLPHDLFIPDLGVHLAVAPGRQTTTGIEIDEAGSYQFLCSYPGHAAAGMTGLLTVNPNP
jgi:nitrite reductase (NO-forming)